MKYTFVVTAYRWGSRSNHSYLVGVYTDESTARSIADEQTMYRGGKYACTVEQVAINSGDGADIDAEIKIIYRTESMMDQKDVQTLPDNRKL